MKHIFILIISLSYLIPNNILIRSSLVDENDKPITNANIYCADNATRTNEKGAFSLYCHSLDTLHIKHIKYDYYSNISSEIKNITKIKSKVIEIDEIKVFGGIKESNKNSKIHIIKNNQINNNGINHIEDVIQNSSFLMYSGGTSRGQYYQMRGIGELSQFSGEGAPHYYITTIIDNIDFSGIGGIGILDDVKQIEIFKGSHSTTFGTNSMAGAINIISEYPKNFKETIIRSTYSDYNTNNFSVTINTPFNKNLKSRITYVDNYTDGMIYNSYLQKNNTNSKKENLLRIKLNYISYSKNIYDISIYLIDKNNKYDVWTPDNNGFITYSDYQGFDNQNTKAISLKKTNIFDNFKIINIATYSDNDIKYSYDGDWGNDSYWLNGYNFDSNLAGYSYSFTDMTLRNRKHLTYENRLYFKNLVLGIYNSKLKENDSRDGWLFAGIADNILSKFKINNSAFFLKHTSKLSKKLYLDTHIRYDIYKTINELTYNNSLNQDISSNHLFKDKTASFNLDLSYNINDNNILRVSFANGHKTGGINQSPNFESNRMYKSDISRSVELGYKFLTAKTNIGINIFKVNRYRPQLRLYVQHDINTPTSFDYATFNGNQFDTFGIDFNSNFNINKYIVLLINYSYLNSKLSSFTFNNIKYGDRQTAHSPKYKYQLSIIIKPLKNLSLKINKTFTDDFYFDDQSEHMSNSYYILNASMEIKIKHFNISLWSKNIDDIKYPIRGYKFALDPTFIEKEYVSYGDRKNSGITMSYIFKN